MKRHADARWRPYPHVIEFRQGTNARHAVPLSNEHDAAAAWALYSFTDHRLLDGGGDLTPLGRDIVLRGMIARTDRDPARFCIVWGPHDCTFLMDDGVTVDGRKPPLGEPVEPESYLGTPAELVDCRYVELPEGCAASHICIVGLTRRRAEIASGGPVTLGRWDEPVPPGRTDPLAGHYDADGGFTPPAIFRGHRVTGVRDDRILGPVQPDGEASFVVEPWPGQVFEACRRLAGRDLPDDVLAAVWRAVDPVDWDVLQTGIRLAA